MIASKLLMRQPRIGVLFANVYQSTAKITYSPYRTFFMLNNPLALRVHRVERVTANTMALKNLAHNSYQNSLLTPFSLASFSLKRHTGKFKKGPRRYKLKTNKAARKRFFILGAMRDKRFQFKSSGARHLMRNKSKTNKLKKRKMKVLHTYGDIRYMKRLLPYYKKTQR